MPEGTEMTTKNIERNLYGIPTKCPKFGKGPISLPTYPGYRCPHCFHWWAEKEV